MSSVPVAPAPITPIVVAPKPSAIGSATTIIMILAFLSIITAGAVYFVDFLVAKHDVATAAKYETILNTQVAQTKALEQQLTDDEAANAKRDAAYEKTIAQLSQTIIQRDSNAQKQQKVDATLDASAAAQRILQQTKAAVQEATVEGNNVVLDLPVARDVVSDIDTLAVTQADLGDTQNQLATQQNITLDAQNSLADAKSVIASQTAQISDATKACNSQIAVLKAQNRKSKFKWFGIGFVSGFISGLVVHIN